MKKNTMMRIASVLMIAVLLTTCVISGTFAKYVSQTNSSDSARVAKWGWGDTTISIANLFADSYENVTAGTVAQGIIAPGTADSTTISLFAADGFAPEVKYNLTFAAVGNITTELEEVIDWTLSINGEAKTLANNSLADIVAEINDLSGDRAADAETSYEIVIGWTWPIGTNDLVTDTDNVNDTALGNAAAAGDIIVSLDLTVTAIQID